MQPSQWQYAPPSAPPSAASASAGPAKQGLAPGQISSVVMAHYGAFRACYEAAAASRDRVGYVSIAWEMQPDGRVRDARDQPMPLAAKPPDEVPRFEDPELVGCLSREIGSLRFPVAELPTRANWTFTFRPSKPARPALDGGT